MRDKARVARGLVSLWVAVAVVLTVSVDATAVPLRGGIAAIAEAEIAEAENRQSESEPIEMVRARVDAASWPTAKPRDDAPQTDEVLGVTQAVPEPQAMSYEQRGQSLLARVPFDVDQLGYTIAFEPPGSGYNGLTWVEPRRIEIFVDPAVSDAKLIHVMAHEIGHAVDLVRNSAADRQRWRQARGIDSSTPWWPDAWTTDFDTPAGDFAECFAEWLVSSGQSRSKRGSCAGTEALVAELAAG